MKGIILSALLFLSVIKLQAQDYLINFTGTGASTTVGTVTVENLMQGKSLTLNGTEVLHLVKTITGIDPISDNERALHIYPNPTNGNSTIDFVATASGKVNIELFDITGKRVSTAQNIITKGTHSYQVSNLRSGVYTVRISSQSYNYTGKLVSNGTTTSEVKVNYIGNGIIPDTSIKLKSANAEKKMQYTTGDRLKITGKSGNFRTVVVDVPTQNKTITFSFNGCTDDDGKNYSVVKIGSQIWMAENLAYLPKVSLPTSVSNTDPYYYVYDFWGINVAEAKLTNNYAVYGVLYNWQAAKASCPAGWHLPTDEEWTTLTDFLGGESGVGGKMKETGTTHFLEPNTDATNSSGFSGIPGGDTDYHGWFGNIGRFGVWWSSTETSSTFALHRTLDYNWNGIGHPTYYKMEGYSVRCIKD